LTTKKVLPIARKAKNKSTARPMALMASFPRRVWGARTRSEVEEGKHPLELVVEDDLLGNLGSTSFMVSR